MKEIIKFLKELSDNNNREWFNENKAAYREALNRFNEYVAEIIPGLSEFDKNLLEVQSKETIFRIYKDVRFSKDKTPYKTHFGAYMAKGGRKSPDAGYYLHIEHRGTFVAAGVYMPDKDRLKAVRQEIVYKPEEYMKIVNECNENGYTLHDHEDKLKKAPRGFPPDFKYIDEIKLKHYIFAKTYNDKQVVSEGFINSVIADFRALQPYTMFLNTAMDFIGNE